MKTATAVTQSEPTDAHPAPETAEKAQLSGNRISPPAPPHALGNVRLRQRKARAFRSLCQDMVEWRRGDHCAERLRLGPERFPEGSKADEVRALEAVIEEVNQWPDVRQAC